MAQKREPLIVIISAPSGSGKTTIVERLIDKVPGIKRSVSYTTRHPREGEKNGMDYVFVSEEEFKTNLNSGFFLEWEKVFENYYGTSEREVSKIIEGGEDVVLSIDVKGAKTVKEKFPEAVSVFIMPPSMEELSARLKKRNTDKEKEVSLRLEEARREMAAADEYDYLIVNDKIDEAEKELESIIQKERKNRIYAANEKGKK